MIEQERGLAHAEKVMKVKRFRLRNKTKQLMFRDNSTY